MINIFRTKIANILLVLLLCCLSSGYSFQGGNGSSSNPYQISNCVELQNMSSDLTASYELVQDIDCAEINFVPIGNVFPNNFRGDFNGNYFTIYDFYIDNISLNYTGLFGVTNLATIGNVSFYNVSINGDSNVGVLGGVFYSTSLSNVDVLLGDVFGNDNVGALVGNLQYYSRIENSFSFADVSGNDNIGGLVGLGDVSSIFESYSEAEVVGDSNVGGLMGNMSHARVYDSYSRSQVTGDSNVGGLIGISGETGDITIIGKSNTIENSFTLSYVQGSSNVGSVVGTIVEPIIIVDTYWNNVSGNPSSAIGDGNSSSFVPISDNLFYFTNQSNIPLSSLNLSSWNFYLDSLPRLERETPSTVSHFFFQGGVGTGVTPYEISTCLELQNMRNYYNANYILTSDIDCLVEPFGTYGFESIRYMEGDFQGTLRGDDYTVSDFKIFQRNSDNVGLFSRMDSATISEIYFSDAQIYGNNFVGIISGYQQYSDIENVGLTGVLNGNDFVGTLFGGSYSGFVDNAFAHVDIDARDQVGALAGSFYGESGEISNSYSLGDISGRNNVGGLVGQVEYTIISNSYSNTSVLGNDNIGGLVGYLSYIVDQGRIDNSFSIGNVSGTSNVGGLVGFYDPSSLVSNSYWYNSSSNPSIGAGNGYVVGITAINTVEHFTNSSNQPLSGWDVGTWDFQQDFLPGLGVDTVVFSLGETSFTPVVTSTASLFPVSGLGIVLFTVLYFFMS